MMLTPEKMSLIRLNKYISECGVASRRKADELISEGRVSVNGKIVTKLGTKIDPEKDKVKIDGELVRWEKKVYYLLNKPKGVITSTKDEKNRTTVTELIKTNLKIFPVGRLDYNTTGVLLLTNDGEFANFLTHPRNKIEREYLVTLDKQLSKEDREKLLRGIIVNGKKGKFVSVNYTNKQSPKRVKVITVEGRNHFVKNMFAALGYTVKNLERSRFGKFKITGLKRGEYKKLDPKEIKNIMNKNRGKKA